jgi:hypothetical protein
MKKLTAVAAVLSSALVAGYASAEVKVEGRAIFHLYPIVSQTVPAAGATSRTGWDVTSGSSDTEFDIFNGATPITGYSATKSANSSFGGFDNSGTYIYLGYTGDTNPDNNVGMRLYADGHMRLYGNGKFAADGWTGQLHIEHTVTETFGQTSGLNRDNYVQMNHDSGFFMKSGYFSSADTSYVGFTSGNLADWDYADMLTPNAANNSFFREVFAPRVYNLELGYSADGMMAAGYYGVKVGTPATAPTLYRDGANTPLDPAADKVDPTQLKVETITYGLKGAYQADGITAKAEYTSYNSGINTASLNAADITGDKSGGELTTIFNESMTQVAALGLAYTFNAGFETSIFLNAQYNTTKASSKISSIQDAKINSVGGQIGADMFFDEANSITVAFGYRDGKSSDSKFVPESGTPSEYAPGEVKYTISGIDLFYTYAMKNALNSYVTAFYTDTQYKLTSADNLKTKSSNATAGVIFGASF